MDGRMKIVLNCASADVKKSKILPEHCREVSNLFVVYPYRKKGRARALMEKICKRADSMGHVLVIAVTDNVLLPFYKSLGFIEIQQTPIIIMARGQYGRS